MPQAEREELRLALVMNGGVSLAVWMGGVTNEIFRLVTRRHPVYAALLDITHTTARVDVISGTSAGGVNGAALTVALLYGGNFESLRQVWMETGSFADLLRPPMGENPGSLLQGDEFFLGKLEEALSSLVPDGASVADPATSPIDLRLTTTLLTGRQVHTVDDLGSAVNDVDYRAHFRFRHLPLDKTDFADPAIVIPRLARAARSTASFPFAFEPSHVTRENSGDHLRDVNGRPLAMPRYVIDGGVLNNRPFEGARQAIFEMQADSSVRRVLAYINPDPGDGPPGKLGGPRPSLSKVLVEGVLAIPQSQTIADQLNAIESHNETVRKRRDSVLTLIELDRWTTKNVAEKLFKVYRKRRLATTFDIFFFDQLTAAAERRPLLAKGLRVVGKRGRAQMKLAFDEYGDRPLRWLPLMWPKTATDPAYQINTWAWGLFPVEFAAKILIDMLRKAQRLIDAGAPTVPPALVPVSTIGRGWSDPGFAKGNVDQPNAGAYGPSTLTADVADHSALVSLWKRANDNLSALSELREDEQRRYWDVNAEAVLQLLASAADADARATLHAIYPRLFDTMFAFLSSPIRARQCAALAFDVAATIRDLCPLARKLALAALDPTAQLRSIDREIAEELMRLAEEFGDSTIKSLDQIIYTLMQIEIVQFAFADHDTLSSDTMIELVQISGNGESPIGGGTTAKEKLLGLQLAHFGAFYKRSWRANDWLYGRLGGAERMVRILLNADRLHRNFFGNRVAAQEAIRSIAIDSCPSAELRTKLAEVWDERGFADAIESELIFLDDATLDLPDALPACVSAITLRLHYGILENELPYLIDAIHLDQADGADNSGAGAAMVSELSADSTRVGSNAEARRVAEPSPEFAARWLQNGLLAKETLIGQAGSDLFTRTIAHTAATLQNTIASKATGLGPVSAFFATLKLPIMGFYLAAQGMLAQSRTGAALNGGILALGITLVLLELMWKSKELAGAALPHTLVLIGWALLAYGLLVSLLRTPRTFSLLLAVAALASIFFVDPYTVLPVILLALLAFLSVKYIWLQSIVGLFFIAYIALWGAGWLAFTQTAVAPPHRFGFHLDVLLFAAIVIATLAWAMFQSSSAPRRAVEGFFVALTLKRSRQIFLPNWGMTVTIDSGGFSRDRIRWVVVDSIQSGLEADVAGLAIGDSVVAVDGIQTHGMRIDGFTARFRDVSTSPKKLTAERARNETLEAMRIA